MDKHNLYARSAQIIKRLKLEMPVSATYADPFTGSPITCYRENILSLLVVDAATFVVDAQTCAALYAEMSRFRRAAQLEAAKAAGRYRAWKGTLSNEARAKEAMKDKPKKLTGAEVESYYRTHADYDAMSSAEAMFLAQSGLFEDIARAFEMKARLLHDTQRMIGGHEGTLGTEAAMERSHRGQVERLDEMAAEANAALIESGDFAATESIRDSLSSKVEE